MAKSCGDFHLVDVMDTLHPDDASIPSYSRGSSRLDYALVSSDLLPSVASAGLNHYHEFYPSDHHPIFVGFQPDLLGYPPAISSARTRYVHSNSTVIEKFIQLAYKHLQDTCTFTRLEKFCDEIESLSAHALEDTANSIDDQFTRALLSAKRKCKPPLCEPWSKERHRASLQVKYGRLKLAASKNNYDATVSLNAVNFLLPTELKIIPSLTLTPKQSLHKAYRNLTAKRKDVKSLRALFYRNSEN
jgi:hypothetical protein